jgi:hypothetical protein
MILPTVAVHSYVLFLILLASVNVFVCGTYCCMSTFILSLLNLSVIHYLEFSLTPSKYFACIKEVFRMQSVGLFIVQVHTKVHFLRHSEYYDCFIHHVKCIKK